MIDFLRRFGFGLRLVIATVILVPCGLMMAAMAAYQFVSGSGTMHIVPLPNEQVSVAIDNGPAEVIAANQHWRRDLPQGQHHVTITGPFGVQNTDVNVSNGFWSYVVPTSASECFVEVEATHFYFGTSRSLPTVTGRYPSTEPVSVGSDYLSESELPSSIDDRSSIHMLWPVSCGILNQPDQQLIYSIGYE